MVNLFRRSSRPLVVVLVSLLLPSAAHAQAAITGVVKDASGGVLAGVTVEAASPALIEKARSVVTDDTGQDRIVDSQKQVDFSLGWQLLKGVQLSFDVANVNNEKYYVYQGVQQLNAQYEQYGRTYKLGLKASFF